jgi:RNA-directed DNA polymerase
MSTGLERLAAKARQEPKLRLTSRAQHSDAERLWHNLGHGPRQTAPASAGQPGAEVQQEFGAWREATRRAVHTQGYRPPPVRRPDIAKPGQREHRPLGVPGVGARVLQRRGADGRSALDEPDFWPGSFGGRPGGGAPQARATRHDVRAGKPVRGVYEADRRAFCGSLAQGG